MPLIRYLFLYTGADLCLTSRSARHQPTLSLQDHRYGLVDHEVYLFTLSLVLNAPTHGWITGRVDLGGRLCIEMVCKPALRRLRILVLAGAWHIATSFIKTSVLSTVVLINFNRLNNFFVDLFMQLP